VLIIGQVLVTFLGRLYNTKYFVVFALSDLFILKSTVVIFIPNLYHFSRMKISSDLVNVSYEWHAKFGVSSELPDIFRENCGFRSINLIFRGIPGFSSKELGISFRTKNLIFRIFMTITCHKYDIIEID